MGERCPRFGLNTIGLCLAGIGIGSLVGCFEPPTGNNTFLPPSFEFFAPAADDEPASQPATPDTDRELPADDEPEPSNTVLRGDFDDNGLLDEGDFEIFASVFGTVDGQDDLYRGDTDLDDDGEITFTDYAIWLDLRDELEE